MKNMLVCQVDDLEVRVLELKDASRVEGLKDGYSSYMGEWIYMGTAEDFITGALEQFEKNRIIRPRMKYVGPRAQTFVPLDQR